MESYDHKKIEKKWQEKWGKNGVYKTQEDPKRPKSYVLDMFPYPSGEGLHVGHPKGYIATDIYSRYKKMNGYNVLHPMGWDAFGLPAENYALKNKVHPRVAVEKNITRFKEQLAKIGFNYDWDREINTTDPKYYKWTQWVFLQMFKKGLAYESSEPINWCPSCMTGLANEDLDGDKCERCGSAVEKKPIRQWVLKITDYADRMLEDLDELDWPESIKESQKNWIGRSKGAEIDFEIKGLNKKFTIFTTRPDTLFGATYCVLAPEHVLVKELKDQIENWNEVLEYIKLASEKSEIERKTEDKKKTGVRLEGITAINPANNKEIPVFIADYVLAHYGAGAIMAVPAHDERDFEFAKRFNLSVKEVVLQVIGKELPKANRRDGVMGIIKNKKGKVLIQYNEVCDNYRLPGGGIDKGETEKEALRREIEEETGYTDFDIGLKVGSVLVHYPNPILKVNRRRILGVYEVTLNSEQQQKVQWSKYEKLEHTWMRARDGLTKLNSGEIDLGEGVLLERYITERSSYTGEGVLINSGEFDGLDSEEAKKAITEFVGGKMKTTYKLHDWVFSRQRYWGEPIPIIHCEKCGVVSVPETELPVELPEVKRYEPTGTGESPLAGIEEWVNTKCPECGGNGKRETNTMPQWAGSSWYYLRYIDPANDSTLVDFKKEKYWSPVDMYVGGAEHATRHLIYARFWHKFLYDIGVVNYTEPFKRLQHVGLIGAEDGKKMSKRYGNVVNPDDIVETYGADTLRVYEMFMGPFDQGVMWSTDSILGPRRFLEKVWRLAETISEKEGSSIEILLHQTIKKVGADIESFDFNTAISSMMIFINVAEKAGVSTESYKTFLKLLAPFAPHITEELWEKIGENDFIHNEIWPVYEKALIIEKMVTIVVQVDGKVRGELEMDRKSDKEKVEISAKELPQIKERIGERDVQKVIYIPDRLINFVT